MYVIFPADEIVYLSYGHLIYVPSTPQPDNELRTPPIRTSLEENQPSFQSISVSSSSYSESPTPIKEKPSPGKNWDKFDCIGSRSIDLESRTSVDRSRSNEFTSESRTPEPSQRISRSDIINRSGLSKSPAPSTSTYIDVPKSQPQEPSIVNKFPSSKNLNQGESKLTFDRYAATSTSLKTKNQINQTQGPDHFKIFSSFNRSKKQLKSPPQIPQGTRLPYINKPPRRLISTESAIPESEVFNKPRSDLLQKNKTLTEFGFTNNELQESVNASRAGSSNRSLRGKNQEETDNIGFSNLGFQEFQRLSITNRSVRSKNSAESDTAFRSVQSDSLNRNLKPKYIEAELVVLKNPDLLDTSRNKNKSLRTQEEGSKTLSRAYNSNSNKSSKSSKNSSNSSRSSENKTAGSKPTGARSRTVSDSVSNTIDQPKKKLNSNSFTSFIRSSVSKDKTLDLPIRPERKKDKRVEEDKGLPRPDSSSQNRELVSRSDIINTRSDQVQDVKNQKPVLKREKSPVIRFFRAQSSSPRTLGRDKSAFDFDVLFKQDPNKLNANSSIVGLRTRFGSDTNLTNLSGTHSGETE